MAKSFDDLVKRTTGKRTRERAAARTRELLGELLLSEIQKLAGKSRHEVADALGIKQPSLSKLEGQSDMQISTLRKIVAALGGELDVIAPGAQKSDLKKGGRSLSTNHDPETRAAIALVPHALTLSSLQPLPGLRSLSR